ncbi:MAG: O-antigen ligase family protein [Eubacteriales bacterium]|nr:O-antigen ligase family protein [Eubacteriales bacterium]
MADDKKRFPFAEYLRGSLILSALSHLSDFIYRSASESMAGKALTSYDRCSLKAGESLASGAAKKLNAGSVLRRLKRFCIKSFENSALITGAAKKMRGFLDCSMRYYGTFLLSFGIYASGVFGIKYYMNGSAPSADLGVAIIAALFSIPMIISTTALSEVILSSRILSGLLFGVIGVRRESIESVPAAQSRPGAAFIAGMTLGLSAYFASPGLILAGLAGIVLLYTILIIPESGVTLIIFSAPFMSALPRPSIITALMVLYVAGCYILKLIRGKRVFRFEILDGAVALFLLLTLLGGIFTVSVSVSLEYALIYGCYLISYFLVVNLIRTDKWVRRCVGAFISSSVIVSLVGIYQHLLGTASTRWQDLEMFTGMGGRVISTFENPNVLAEYLIMAIPFAVALLLTRRSWMSRGAMIVACGMGLACLVFTMSRGAWLGFIAGMLVFLLIYSRRTLVMLFLGSFAIPLLPFVLPADIVRRFTSIGNMADSSTAYRVNIWNGSIDMIRDFLWGGIGAGRGAFTIVYPSYTLAGIESAPHSHNLYLQITIELGIFGLIAFLAVVFLLALSTFTFLSKKPPVDAGHGSGEARLVCAAGFAGITAILVQGMTDYVWYNYRIFLIFWLVAGLTAAVKRSSEAVFTGDRYDNLLLHTENITAGQSEKSEQSGTENGGNRT